MDKMRDDMIKEILTSEKEITLFVRAHLYLEHYLDAAIEEKFPHQVHLLDVPYFSTELKLRVLHGFGFLSDVLYYNGLKMNRIRNKFAHRLEPSEDGIKAAIDSMLMPWKTSEAMAAMDRFEIYKNVAVTTILAIKNALEEGRDADFYPGTSIPDSQK